MKTALDLQLEGIRHEANQKILDIHDSLHSKDITPSECADQCAKVKNEMRVAINVILQNELKAHK